MKIDIHVHSSYSTDSEAKMEDVALAAVRGGIRVLCFTDHIDWDYPVEGLTFDFDPKAYEADIKRLTQKFRGKKDILMGELTSPVEPPKRCRFYNRCIYAQEQCRCEEPPLEEILPGHFVACHCVRIINDL